MPWRKIFMLVGLGWLALVVGALPLGVTVAYGNDGPLGLTWYANSPSGTSPASQDTGVPIRKFFDKMAGVGLANANALGQYMPIAVADPANPDPTYDLYKIGIVEYSERLHTDLAKPTKLRGYKDLMGVGQDAHYLGPIIVAKRDRPVRVLVENQLPAGNLFLPVDTTLMGTGVNPDAPVPGTKFAQNRTAIHLHGGFTPWISDGTPHQWFTPTGTILNVNRGWSFRNVPDRPDPGAGKQTLYYTNQQSGRLMFYHDHALGITRLNVYAGMAAGYLIYDPVEEDLINGTDFTGVNPTNAKIIPGFGETAYKFGIPLIIQDKTFVPKNVGFQDSKWQYSGSTLPTPVGNWGDPGDLWFPHIYEANQSPPGGTDPTGMNQYGRWDFGPWVQPNILAPIEAKAPELKAAIALPGTDVNNPQNYPTSVVPEAFMDTMMVNGTVYPYYEVQPKAYRFRILNACNDRFLNLQLYLDASGGGTGATATATVDTNPISPTLGQINGITNLVGGSGFVRAPGINITGGGGVNGWLKATIDTVPASPTFRQITGITIIDGGTGYTSAPTLTIGATTEVKMVPASKYQGNPPTWPTDGRDGGVPDAATAGPKFIQIGTEGGFLPGVVEHNNQPINYDYDRGSSTFGNVLNTGNGITIFIGPAERADVIVDFSTVAPGTNVILYNDAPSPVPGFQPRYDYYTGNPDLTSTGGAPQTQVGVGPNTRTVMQFRVAGPIAAQYDVDLLKAALPDAYVKSQPPPIVPQTYYPVPYQHTSDQYARINDTALTFTPVGSTIPKTLNAQPKAIVELFEQYGRMNATLGYEFFDPTTNPARSNGVGFAYIDPPEEVFRSGETQIWKLTHNGVDTHPVHFHLANVQIINRVGWDGVIKPPEPFERGWKETIRMNPLESIFFAMKADLPKLPFSVPDSVRPLNPAEPLGSTVGFTNINPKTGQPLNLTPTVNVMYNFSKEYAWHCHILGHEENDMMRPLVVTAGTAPVGALYELLLTD